MKQFGLRELFAVVVCVFLLGDRSLSSDYNRNFDSKNDGGESAPGKVAPRVPSLKYLALEKLSALPESKRKELGISYGVYSLNYGVFRIHLTEVIQDEIYPIIGDFYSSKEGEETAKLYIKLQDLPNLKCSTKLPITADNVSSFIELQAFVSPQLRKALKLYLFLKDKGVLEVETDKKREDYLRCLCADDYTAEQQKRWYFVIVKRARYISPLVQAAKFSKITIDNFMSKKFPLSLSNNVYLTAINIEKADFSEDCSCDTLLQSTLSEHLKNLYFLRCKLPQNFGKILSGMTKLKHLALRDCLRGYQGVQDVLKSIPNTVTSFNLRSNGFSTVPQLPELPLLNCLDLRSNKIEDYPTFVNGLGQPIAPGLYQRAKEPARSRIEVLDPMEIESYF